MIGHGSTQEIERKKVRKGRQQARRVSDAAAQEGNAPKREKRQESDEQEAGDRDRTQRGARERRQGAAKEGIQPEIFRQEIVRTEILRKKIVKEEIELGRAGDDHRAGW